MWFWRQIVSLFQRLRTMADDQLSESTPTSAPMVFASNGPEFPPDPDSRPYGRCYPEQLRATAAVAALKAAQKELMEAVSAFGDCRAAARAAAGDFASANQSGFDMGTGVIFDSMESRLDDLEDVLNRECDNCLTNETEKSADITE